MTVKVLYFATLRDRKGVPEESVSVQPGTTLGELYDRLFPAGPEGRVPVAFTRNRVVATAETAVEDGDEVSFLPPLGGG